MRRYAWLLVLLLLAVPSLACDDLNPTRNPSATHTVTFEVTGSARTAFVAYRQTGIKTSWIQQSVILPWRYQFKQVGGYNCEIRAQNNSGGGTMILRIHVGDGLVFSAEEDGANKTIEASGAPAFKFKRDN